MPTTLSPIVLLLVILTYFMALMVVAYFTGRGGDNESFFTAKRQSPWFLVAVGMIGASLSGVTFISIPGVVGAGGKNMGFSYMQMVYGYLLGYFVIATVLMPLYYSLNLITIYGYLEKRFGYFSYKISAFYFILSRIIGASLRLFLVAIVLQTFVMDALGVSFFLTVGITIVLIWIYTFQGGIKTIVWTDTLQTICMITAVVLTIFSISQSLNMDFMEILDRIKSSGYSKMFHLEGAWQDENNFFKQFISGALIAIVMTGLDQDMMQKNLTCRDLKSAQKNVFAFSIILVIANILFLTMGALLYIYAAEMNVEIPQRSDQLYPTLALQYLSPSIGIIFLLGLIAAAYSSADSALTSLTTSFCVDFLNFQNTEKPENQKKKIRYAVHISFSLILFFVILIFKSLNNDAIVNSVFLAAGYTYGPILGLFAFGILTSRKIKDKFAIWVCLFAPILSYLVDRNSELWFNGLKFGFLIIALNGFLTFMGLWMISIRAK